MYKLVIISMLLATLAFAATTDILPPKEASNELAFIATDNYECNYFIELAGQDLLLLASSHSKRDYDAFMEHSTKATTICVYINKLITNDIVNIQNDVTYFYNQNYK